VRKLRAAVERGGEEGGERRENRGDPDRKQGDMMPEPEDDSREEHHGISTRNGTWEIGRDVVLPGEKESKAIVDAKENCLSRVRGAGEKLVRR